MILYVVTSVCDYEYGNVEIVGLFSTKPKAEKCIEDLGGQQYWTSFSGQVCPQYYIEEWEVDRND